MRERGGRGRGWFYTIRSGLCSESVCTVWLAEFSEPVKRYWRGIVMRYTQWSDTDPVSWYNICMHLGWWSLGMNWGFDNTFRPPHIFRLEGWSYSSHCAFGRVIDVWESSLKVVARMVEEFEEVWLRPNSLRLTSSSWTTTSAGYIDE